MPTLHILVYTYSRKIFPSATHTGGPGVRRPRWLRCGPTADGSPFAAGAECLTVYPHLGER
jgi:hypothetical protein